MKNIFGVCLVLIFSVSVLTSCSGVDVNGGEEAVFVKKPWIFGRGGVVDEPLIEGQAWKVFTTDAVKFDVKPVQYEEPFDDIITEDNNPVDFNAYIKLKIQNGKTPILYETFGVEWYKNNLQQPFRKDNRNLCSDQKMFDLTSDRQIVDSLSLLVLANMRALVTKLGMPVDVEEVYIGKVVPPDLVLEETMKTAAAEQSIITQDANRRSEDARASAQSAKAKADMAYKNTMNYSNDQYLTHRSIEVQNEQLEIIKGKKNVAVTLITGSGVGGATPVLPVR